MAADPNYQVTSQVDTTWFDQASQQAVRGTEFRIHWFNPDVYFTVRLPDGYVSAANLTPLVYATGNARREIVGLPAVKPPAVGAAQPTSGS